MTRKLTFLMTAMVLILAIMGPRSVAWGQTTYTELFTIASADVVTNSSYAKYETTVSERDWIITFGGNNKSVGTNSSNRSKCNLSSYSKYAVSPVTTSDVASAFVSKTSISDVSKISYTFNGGSNQTNTNVYLIYSSDGNTFSQVSLTSGTQGATISSGTAYEFAKCSGYFGLLFKATNSSGNWRIDDVNITFYKASTPSTTPTCTIDPTSHDFGEIAVGGSATFDFTVTTANLTEDLTLAVSEGFSVSPATINSTETETTVTVTCAPTVVGALDGTLTISGGGLTDNVTATLTATGIGSEQYTITYSAANGTAPEAQQVTQGSSVTLPTINDVDCNTWQFAGWSESENSTEAPTLMAGDEYTPEDDVTLYAVYKKQTGNETADYTLQYDTWTYSGTTANKTSYRLFGNGAYIESVESHDLSNVTAVKITMRTFGGTDYKNVNIEDASGNVWGNAAATGSTLTEITATKTNGLTGNGKLRIKSKSGNGTSTGVGISKVVYTVNNTSYTYSTDPDCSTPVATPTITPNGGEFIGSQEITLACTTEGATISYTTDDWETSNTYSAPFTITATTTLKVKATKEGMSESETVSATFTKIQVLETIQAIFDASATAGNYYVTFNNWVVSGVNGSNAYVTDGTKGFIVYKSGHGFKAGDVISGTAQLALTRYNGAAEFTSLTAGTSGLTVTEGGTVTPVEMNIADLGGVNTGAVITVNNVEYTGSDIFSDGENTIKAYNTFMTLPTFTNGDSYNITGVYIQYNTTKEIAPRSAADIQLIVAAPTFTPEGGDYNAAQNVEIASATAGAAIYYTLDGSDPTVESTLYSAPIELTSNTTLKAIAAKAGSVSEIATAVYTITITTVATPTFEPEVGSYFNESLEVSLDCATDGATIVYTTDNWATQTTYSDPFTITETTTVKAKATKADMDDSEIAEATYTKRYKVDYVVNGDATAIAAVYVTPEEAISTLPTATAPNGYTFRGWSAGDVALTDVEPTYIAAETIPTGDMTLKAVFAMGETGETTFVTKDIIAEAEITSSVTLNADNNPYQMGELPITLTGIKGTSNFPALNYNATNGTDLRFYKGTTCGVTFATTNNSTITKIEFRKNESTASNLGTSFSANVGTLSANVWTGSAGSVTISYNNSTTFKEQMYIINVTYSETAPSTFYNYCTSVTALSGNLADATTVANTAYYISDESNVPANTTATINGVLGNADASLLVIEDGGQLICYNEVAATVQKNIEAINGINGWYTIASPVKGSIDVPAAMTSNEYDLYYYDEPEYTWRNYEANSFQLANRKGYLYANRTDTDIEFAGTLRAGNEVVEVDLSYESTYQKLKGFNLVGNPFAHNIIMGTNAIMTNGNTGYYVVEHGANLVAKTFETPIKPCQGFMVQATVEGRKITFNPSSSAKETQTEHEYITIAAGNGDFMDMAYICTNADEKLGKITLDNPTAKVYLQQNGNDYAIAPLGEATSMVVCFKAPASGTYTINVSSDVEGVSLKDMKTGYVTAINHSASYTFEAGEDDAEGRFKILFGTTGVEENEAQMFVMQSGSDLIISGEGTVQIIDMMGRVLRSAQVESNATVSTEGLTAGAYVVRMLTAGGVQTQKVIVK